MKVTWRSCGSSPPIIAAALFVFLPLTPAATITVSPGGGGNADLQAAVDAATDGDTVLVEPGDYTLSQSLDLNRRGTNPPRNLTVRSIGGAARTVLRLAGGAGPGGPAAGGFRAP